MTSAIYFRPGIPLLIALICGIALGSEYKGFEYPIAAVLVVAAAWIGRQVYRRQGGALFPILFFAALGYLSLCPWVQPGFPANHVIHYAGSQRWDITGTIDSRPEHIHNRIRLTLRVASLGDDHQIHTVRGKLRLTVTGDLPQLAVGDGLRQTRHR